MKMLSFFMFTCLAASALGATNTCESGLKGKVTQFNGKSLFMAFPCKYWALKDQTCGDYSISLSPSNLWLGKRYYLDTLWISVKSVNGSAYWEGRTTNKLAVKFLNAGGVGRELFNTRSGTMDTSHFFNMGVSNRACYARDKAGNFRVSFTPWDPEHSRYPYSAFKFECFKDTDLKEYPEQMCGGEEVKVLDRAKADFQLEDRFKNIAVFHDVFTAPDIVHMNEKCHTAMSILTETCQTPEQRILALRNCYAILASDRHTRCVTTFTCDPMDAFNSCLAWGCTGTGFETGEDHQHLCYAVGQSTDLCPRIDGAGNLTDRLDAASCYKDFKPIERNRNDLDATN